MAEQIEKVKSAIAEKFAPAIDFKAPYAKVMLDMAARAAIEAMRRLTPEMHRAAHSPLVPHFIEEAEAYGMAQRSWDAAIDAALKG